LCLQKTLGYSLWISLWSHPKRRVPWSFKNHGLEPFSVNMPLVWRSPLLAHPWLLMPLDDLTCLGIQQFIWRTNTTLYSITLNNLTGCTVLNLYESTWVHKRGIDLDLAILRIHTIDTFRTEKYSRILTLNIYLKRNTSVYKDI